MDMTPMVDLAFLLLTFFILTTRINQAFVVKVEMPEKQNTQNNSTTIKPEQLLTIVLDEKDEVYWYVGIDHPKVTKTNFSRQGIGKVLQEKNAAIAGMFVFIKPSERSRYQNMVDVFDKIREADVKQYSLMELTPEDQALIRAADL